MSDKFIGVFKDVNGELLDVYRRKSGYDDEGKPKHLGLFDITYHDGSNCSVLYSLPIDYVQQ